MWIKITQLFLIFLFPTFLWSQKEAERKFEKEKFIHFKAGLTLNQTNSRIFNELNAIGNHTFTPIQDLYYNPSAAIEFESHFSKFIGLSLNLGFLQLRQRYHYSPGAPAPGTYIAQTSNLPKMKEPTDGIIISNIPHVDLAPSFYLTPMTRLTAGFGYYKYYYRFNPIQIGDFGFNLNNEGYALYSNISVCQSFDIQSYRCSLTLKCFGLTRVYDRGYQFSIGLVL